MVLVDPWCWWTGGAGGPVVLVDPCPGPLQDQHRWTRLHPVPPEVLPRSASRSGSVVVVGFEVPVPTWVWFWSRSQSKHQHLTRPRREVRTLRGVLVDQEAGMSSTVWDRTSVLDQEGVHQRCRISTTSQNHPILNVHMRRPDVHVSLPNGP